MARRIIYSAKGLTLVELLATLTIFSLISIIIIGYLVGGMKSFTSVNEEIALHDEANYVMSQFVNYIFVATSVAPGETPGGKKSTIKVTKFGDSLPTVLGFDESGNAVINGNVINHSGFKFSSGVTGEDSRITIQSSKNAVKIRMVIQERNSNSFGKKKKLVLDSEVSYVKVE